MIATHYSQGLASDMFCIAVFAALAFAAWRASA